MCNDENNYMFWKYCSGYIYIYIYITTFKDEDGWTHKGRLQLKQGMIATLSIQYIM